MLSLLDVADEIKRRIHDRESQHRRAVQFGRFQSADFLYGEIQALKSLLAFIEHEVK